jgi:hypothetical protein
VVLEMAIAVTMLIYTVSLEFQLPTSVIIHNQCLNTELISPIYFGNGTVCPKLSGQQIDINTAMKIRFEICAIQNEFKGALLYKLQRNLHDQCRIDASTTETNRNEAIYVYMFVAWKMKDSKPFICVVLVECTKEFAWNQGRLMKLYDKNHNLFKKYDETISDTWFLGDSMTLKTSFKVRSSEKNFELSVSISEEERDDYAMKPLWINPKR